MNTSGSTKGRTPNPALIDSMSMRYRHDFGLLTEQQQNSVRRKMIQLWEEVVGLGFYKQPDEPVDDEQWQRSMEDAVRFRFFFDPHRGETSKAILGLTMKALTPPYPSVDAWRAAIDADRLGLTKAASAVEPSAGQPPAFYRLNRKGDAYDSAFYPADEWDLVLVPNALTKAAEPAECQHLRTTLLYFLEPSAIGVREQRQCDDCCLLLAVQTSRQPANGGGSKP